MLCDPLVFDPFIDGFPVESIFCAFSGVKYFLLGVPLAGVPSGENSL